jgi:kynurenine formamidase
VNKSLQIQANEEELIRRAKAEYMRAWRQRNREKVLAYNREWRKQNKDKVKEYNRRYWLKKAREKLN